MPKNIQINKIIALHEMNKTNIEIAKQLGISRHTVSLWINKHNNGEKMKVAKGRGRRKKLTDDQERIILDTMYKNVHFTVNDLKKELILSNISVSDRTLIRTLKKHNFNYDNLKKKHFLTEVHKNIRMQFALNNMTTDWLRVIFSDEVTIIKDRYKKKYWIGPKSSKVIGTFKHPIKRNVWGCITSWGIGNIFVFKGIMDANLYINILIDNLLPMYNEDYIFQHDNDPKHTAAITSSFLIEQNIKVLVWSPCSPDLNPIENVWKLLKDMLIKENITNSNFDDAIVRCWNKIKFEHIYNCIESIPIRLSQVIQNNGGHINY